MLTKIIEFSIKNKLIIGLFIIGLIGYGSYEVTRLPIDAVPDITDNQVQVITVAPALGAPDVERLITFPIEQVNSNIPGLKQIRSFSRFGLSVVTIVFNDGVDVYWARQQVAERLQEVQNQIPTGFGTPKLAPVTTGLGEIYQYTIRPKEGYESKYSAMDLRTIQDWIVRRQLLGVKGVADISSFGGYLKQYEIAVNPAKLKANNITMNDVFASLENNNQNTGGAYIEKGPTVLFIRTEGLITSLDNIKSIVVKNLDNGTPLLISDIADVGFGNATRYGAMTYNGMSEVSGAVVMMLKGANSNEVIKNIKERIDQIKKTLPEGVMIDAFLDRTKMVDNSISTVSRNLMEGALIVIFVLVLFLGNFRAGFLVASVIPLAMLFAVIMMNIFGVSGNLMSLGALDFGLIVDGAVIIVESVMHILATRKRYGSAAVKLSQNDMDGEVKLSASRMMNSAVFGQIIILIVYLPIFTLEGIEGKMFKPMAQTVAFALLGAFILSLTYIPMMSALFLSKKVTHNKTFSDKMMERLEHFYRHTLLKALKFPKTIIGTVIGLFAVAVFILTQLGGEFIPVLPEGDFAVETRVLTGSNLNTSINAVSTGARILLKKFPEIEKIVGKTGSSEIPTDPMPIDATDMIIILKNRSEWTSASTYEELEAKMSKALEDVPGVTFGFQYPVAMRFNELLSGARQDVVCKIFGENLDTLALFAKKLGNVCNSVNGSSGLYVEAVTGMPQIVIQYDRASIAQYGLNIRDINRVVNTAFAGQSSGLVYEGEKRFDLVVRLGGEQRKSLEDVQNLLIPTLNGTIPLYQVAKVEVIDGPNQIQRENAQRRIIIGFNVRGRDVQSMVKELKQKVDRQIKLPTGYYITYGGAFENLAAAKNRLGIAVPVSLLLIFMMLYFAFRSVKQGLLIYSAIPLSAIGGIIALAIRGISFSISAGVGFIALFGVAVLNGIVLIAEFNRLKKEDGGDIRKIVLEGTKTRLRPVLMTAFVASLGFLPMALSNGEGAEVQRPLATVVIGGLLIATLLTLFVLPILYILFEKGTKSTPVKPLVTVLIMALFFSYQGKAQTPVTLQAAIDTAIKNNLSLRNEKLNAEYMKKLTGTGIDLPQTVVTGEYGQINSFFKDTKFGVAQSIKFPTVYSRQKSVLNLEWKNSVLNVTLKEKELKSNVTTLFYELLYLQEKQSLLQHIDSIYVRFLKNAELRFSKGESNILEKTTAEIQRGQVNQQFRQLQQDYEIVQLQFKLLLNTNLNFVALKGINKPEIVLAIDTSSVNLHPLIARLQQQQQISTAKYRLERSKLLPDLFIAYNNMSMRGFGADEKLYNYSARFQSVQGGIGIPLFFGAQKSKINALKINQQIADNNYQTGMATLKSEYRQAFLNYQKNLQAISYFENSALKNAELIITTANEQFSNGEISYLDWVLLINQSVSIQSDYIDTLKAFNQSIIRLNFLTNK